MAEPAISVRNVSKSFPGVQALRGVSLDVHPGEVHGLVGANGAGKSTLIRILSGAHAADSGEVVVGGAIAVEGARGLRDAGVAAIYQELNIVPEMSAVDNVFLGAPLRRGPFADRSAMRRRFAELAAHTGASFPADAKAGALSVANRQLIEIMRAVQAKHSVMIMDEPTAPLGPAERARLYDLVARLKAEGTAIIFISHDLDEVLRLCDSVSVMRDGLLVRSGPARGFTKQALVAAMLGKVATPPPRAQAHRQGPAVLRMDGLSAAGWVSGVSFTLHEGEILGIAGLVGAGRTEVLRALAGADPLAKGRMAFAGEERPLPRSIREAIGLGIALAPEDRKGQGLLLDRDGAANLTLAGLQAIAVGPVTSLRRRAQAARRLADSVGFDPARLGAAARTLSGGNQQKLVLGKWLHRRPRVLLLDEPTRGIDVGAKAEIFATVRALVSQGMAVILVSSDLEEVVDQADRVLVMARGRQVALLDHEEASVARILNAVFAVEDLADEQHQSGSSDRAGSNPAGLDRARRPADHG